MRFMIKISPLVRPLFKIFGFSAESSNVELADGALHFRFGSAFERVPLGEVASVAARRWPFYYGLGPKLGPDGGVSWVGSTDGVVKVELTTPRSMHAWGPFGTAKARCVNVSLEDPEGFVAAVEAARAQRA